MKSKIFIGSSVEGLNFAYAIQQNLAYDAEATVWSQGVFELSKTTIESLDKIVNSVDFAVFVFSPDDEIVMRGNSLSSVRDNVLFEFGLFIGRLGRERVFFIVPEDSNINIPTDLLGVTSGSYDPNREDENHQAATGVVCNQIRNQINNIGKLTIDLELDPDDSSGEESSEKPEWLDDFLLNDYISAKRKLEEYLANKPDEDQARNLAWLKYMKFKLNEENSLLELCAYVKNLEVEVSIKALVFRFLIVENFQEKVLNLLDDLSESNPLPDRLMMIKAECYSTTGDDKKAIDILTEINREECNLPAVMQLVEIYEKQRDLHSMLKILNKAYFLFFDDEKLMYKYSRVLDDAGKDKEALYLLNELTKKYPEKYLYWGYLSNSCLQLDLYDKAMVSCKKAEKLSEGKEGWIIHNIGNLLNNKGFFSESIEWLNRGLDVEKNSQYAHDRISSALKNRDNENKLFKNYCNEGRYLIRSNLSH